MLKMPPRRLQLQGRRRGGRAGREQKGDQMAKDWTFDLGTDQRGFFMVEAWASTIPNRTYSRLRREQLLQLRRAINDALQRYPEPKVGEWEYSDDHS